MPFAWLGTDDESVVLSFYYEYEYDAVGRLRLRAPLLRADVFRRRKRVVAVQHFRGNISAPREIQ